jgi:hypothetical protein
MAHLLRDRIGKGCYIVSAVNYGFRLRMGSGIGWAAFAETIPADIPTSRHTSRQNNTVWMVIVQEVRRIPVKRASPVPASLQIEKDFEITGTVITSLPNIVIHLVNPVTELNSEITIQDEIVNKVIQDPMPQGGKNSYANNPAIILWSIDCPLESGQQERE